MPAGFSLDGQRSPSSSRLGGGTRRPGGGASLVRWACILLVGASLGACVATAWIWSRRRGSGAASTPVRTEAQGAFERSAAEGLRGVAEAAAARARRQRLIVLSDGAGRWNTGVWSGWGESPAMLNWAAAGVRVEKKCPVSCEFTRDQSRIGDADAVVMELINHPKFGLRLDEPIAWPAPMRPNPRAGPDAAPRPTAIPPRLPLTVLFYYEAAQTYPRYSMGDADVMAHVDVTMTPSTKSMLPVTMVCPWGRKVADFTRPPPAKTPGRLLSYFNEHGVAPAYARLVDELFAAAGERMDSFVSRRNKAMPDEAGGSPYQLSRRLDFMGTYKFVLVTESIEEEDWVEPDLSQAFLAGAVPVYIGAPNALSYVPGPRSFVHARDFPSGAALWAYLASFDDDSPAGQARFEAEFFAWKSRAALAFMMDEQGQENPVGTGYGVMTAAILPQATLRAQMQLWAAAPAAGAAAGAIVPSLEERSKALAGEAMGFDKLAEAAWRSFRRRLDHCVHYAECRLCELTTLLTQA